MPSLPVYEDGIGSTSQSALDAEGLGAPGGSRSGAYGSADWDPASGLPRPPGYGYGSTSGGTLGAGRGVADGEDIGEGGGRGEGSPGGSSAKGKSLRGGDGGDEGGGHDGSARTTESDEATLGRSLTDTERAAAAARPKDASHSSSAARGFGTALTGGLLDEADFADFDPTALFRVKAVDLSKQVCLQPLMPRPPASDLCAALVDPEVASADVSTTFDSSTDDAPVPQAGPQLGLRCGLAEEFREAIRHAWSEEALRAPLAALLALSEVGSHSDHGEGHDAAAMLEETKLAANKRGLQVEAEESDDDYMDPTLAALMDSTWETGSQTSNRLQRQRYCRRLQARANASSAVRGRTRQRWQLRAKGCLHSLDALGALVAYAECLQE